MDKIIINGLSVNSLIGVYDWERESETTLIVDLCLELDLSKPARSDDVADTVDYAHVAELVASVASDSKFELLEALADSMITAVMQKYPVLKGMVRITKPGILPNAQNVAIELNREA